MSRERRTETAQLSDTNIYPEQPDVSLPKSTQQNYGNNTILNYNKAVAANNINAYVPSNFNVSVRNINLQIEPKVGHFNQLQNSLLQIQHPHHYNPGNINDAELLPYAPMRTTKNDGFINAYDYNNYLKHNPHNMYDSRHSDAQFQRQ